MTYQGTWRTLVKNGGFTTQEAIKIEEQYHKLYSVSDQWVENKLREASKTGYVELAFGLRLYTPILKQIIFESESSMPFEAHKEKKTAGNALGQSYGLLNTKSANLFMERVWDSEWSDSVLPIAQIHDAQYYLVRNSIQCLKWTNDNLIECMEWNELPEIQHPEVKLGAELELYWPNWSNAIAIPNKASYPQIQQCIKQGMQDHANQST